MHDQAINPRQGEELDLEILNKYLEANIPDFKNLKSIKQFPGGYSNLTYALYAESGNYVLRKPPFGAKNIKGGHNMVREFNILHKLAEAGFQKMPKVLHYCADESIIDGDFYVMERIDGFIFRAADAYAQNENLNAKNMAKMSEELCKTLALLHKIDISNNGLISIGKPEGYIKRQVTGWYERYLKSQTHELLQMNELYEWLEANMPNEIKPSLIHNDFKFDNVVFDKNLNEVSALLDWEMTTVGDPRMDIGTCLSYWCEAADGPFEKTFNISWLPGCISREAFLKIYKTINPAVDLSQILYFYVFGLFKNSVVIQQIFSRFHKGLTTDKRFEKLDKAVLVMLNKAIKSIQHQKML